MKFALALLACTALINIAHAQTSATVLVQDSTYHSSYSGLMSTSFVGLKLPSGGGSASLTITPGDWADQTVVSSWADHTQSYPYIIDGPSTVVTIGSTGHYWMYISTWGNNYNHDWLEIRVEASTYSGTVTCYYCQPAYNWQTGWPPVASHQETGLVPVSNQPASQNANILVPRWIVPVLAVVIAVATLLPISYCLYRRHQNKRALAAASSESSTVELQGTSVDVQTVVTV